jgi:hypothetical protein
MLAAPAELGAMWEPRKEAMQRARARMERKQQQKKQALAEAADQPRPKEGSGESGWLRAAGQQQQGVGKVAGQKRGSEEEEEDDAGCDEDGSVNR